MNAQKIFVLSALSAGLAIILGAVAAHSLEGLVPESSIESFKTGTFYHLIHSIVILFLSLSAKRIDKNVFTIITYMVISGTILFSFSIYGLVLKDVFEWQFLSVLGPITPIGGLLLIASWLAIAVFGIQGRIKFE